MPGSYPDVMDPNPNFKFALPDQHRSVAPMLLWCSDLHAHYLRDTVRSASFERYGQGQGTSACELPRMSFNE
ncbi:hypothetical protein BUPH_08383 (plasmid) [Paraburkholderia phenoliruptrix BR3459a]|uniref:Uncharacterized protein n=1 Tax=Paraburkholderia phenoliruptrix BR3459a TaxID=1229205 RepID=K0DW20_9BURK|nr:hypothetical protein BUPH_08383 [Paraburkholderia phenoliruptrix BR3459a]